MSFYYWVLICRMRIENPFPLGSMYRTSFDRFDTRQAMLQRVGFIQDMSERLFYSRTLFAQLQLHETEQGTQHDSTGTVNLHHHQQD